MEIQGRSPPQLPGTCTGFAQAKQEQHSCIGLSASRCKRANHSMRHRASLTVPVGTEGGFAWGTQLSHGLATIMHCSDL